MKDPKHRSFVRPSHSRMCMGSKIETPYRGGNEAEEKCCRSKRRRGRGRRRWRGLKEREEIRGGTLIRPRGSANYYFTKIK